MMNSYRVFYCFCSDPAKVRIIAEREAPNPAFRSMRVVRELATNDCLRRGQLHVHGACFADGDRCVVLSGPKGSGKTTLLLSVLQGGGVRFVANDRLFVDAGALRTPACGACPPS